MTFDRRFGVEVRLRGEQTEQMFHTVGILEA